MVNKLKKTECCGCEVCVSACPVDAIFMKKDGEGYRYPQIDMGRCIQCSKCDKCCPIISRREKSSSRLKAYACYYNNEVVRAESTSGGIFTVIAEYILEKKGIVYGVSFNKDFVAEYSCARNKEELQKFRGSKYSQSTTNKVYENVKRDILSGKIVLFSGLPCQIEGVRSYLEKDYEQLYLLDMACFGIGSPGFWSKYRKEVYPNAEYIRFKDKSEGWKNWKILVMENGENKYYSRYEDLFMKSYLRGINLRLSCYECRFKGINRNSDFTIADCWGTGERSNLNDDRGLSALLLHTNKAEDIFEKIKDRLIYEEYDPDILMKENWAIYKNPQKNPNRENFFEQIHQSNIAENYVELMEKIE